MDKRYEVYLSPEAQTFYDNLGTKEQRKIDFVIDKAEQFKKKYFSENKE